MRLWHFFLIATAMLLALAACNPAKSESRADEGRSDAANANAPGRISGDVTLEGQTDSGGVQVFIPGTNLIAITDKQGHFAIDGVAPGNYELQARADGYVPASVGGVAVVPSAQAQQYVLPPVALKPRGGASAAAARGALGSIRGQVTVAGVGGHAVADWGRCMIELAGTPYRTTCDAAGGFLLWNLPPDQYTIIARLDDFAPARASIRVLPGDEPTSVQLSLRASESATTRQIRGFVEMIGPDGRPTNEFDRVTVQVIGRPTSATTLKPDGSFVIGGLPPARHAVAASAPGYLSSNPVEVDLVSVPEMEVQLTLRSNQATTATTGAIYGVALKNVDNESDMSGITVAVAGSSLMATTDAEGQYRIDNIPPGTYRLIAQAQGFRPAEQGPIQVQAGEDLEVEGMLLDPIRNYPEVLATDPPDGARGIVIRRVIPLTVRFSKKMNADSLRQAVRIDPPVAFQVLVPEAEADLMRIMISGAGDQPIARFRTRYTLTIAETASDVEGLTLQEPFRMSFTTGDPAVISTRPPNRGLKENMAPTDPVSISFNAVMDASSLTPETLRIRPALAQVPQLAIWEDPDTGWSRLDIQGIWRPDTEYRVTVLRRARTAGDNPLTNTPYTFSFRTPKLLLFSPPVAPRRPTR